MGFFSFLFGGDRRKALRPTGTSWDSKPWKMLLVYSDNLQEKAALRNIADGVARDSAKFDFPLLIAVQRKLLATMENRSGQAVAWEGCMYFLWPTGAEPASFLDSFLDNRLSTLGEPTIGKPLITEGDPDPLFTHYPAFEKAAEDIETKEYDIVRCNC